MEVDPQSRESHHDAANFGNNKSHVVGFRERTTQTACEIIKKFPNGTIWQTRFLCLPTAIMVATFAVSNIPTSLSHRLGFFMFGLLSWTFAEYVLHRWVLHYRPKTEVGRVLMSRLHQDHHVDTKNQDLVCIPYALMLPLWFWVFSNFWLFGANIYAGVLWTSGFALAMTVYDITHFSTHYMKAPNWLLQQLKKHHMHHHFSDESGRFGVTSPLWDLVFGTYR